MKWHRGRARRGRRRAGVGAFLVAGLVQGPVAGATADPSKPDGRALYEWACATCHHGGGGLLGRPRTPDLLSDPLPRGDDAAALTRAIRVGVDRPRMPGFGEVLTAAEIDILVDWLLARRAALRSPAAPGDAP